MINVNSFYKAAMNKRIREQGFISITLAEINGIAQNDSWITTGGSYWANASSPFAPIEISGEYATFEKNFVKADGKMLFMPKQNAETLIDVGYCSANLKQAVTIRFGNAYAIKGLTIDFGETYPTSFKITTNLNSVGTTYSLDHSVFETTDTFGEISSLTITPLTMVGDKQRLRIKKILMGVGLQYNNDVVAEAEITEQISSISEDIPTTKFSVKILDDKNEYNVNNVDSFIDYLTGGQIVTISFGIAVDEDASKVEWIKTQTLYLADWSSKQNEFTFSAVNIFSNMDDKYTAGNYIHTRTAYAEAESILTDFGLSSSDYEIDPYLQTVTFSNPMPEDTHANCLLLLCNATRCIFYQDNEGIVKIKGNFIFNIEPENIEVTSVGKAAYSVPKNVVANGAVITHYADFTNNVVKPDDSFTILPKNGTYLNTTGFVSNEISKVDGTFTVNPSVTIKLQSAYSYYGLYMRFTGKAPLEMVVKTYNNGTLVDTFTYTDLDNDAYLNDDFLLFDTITFEFTKAEPFTRIMLDYVGKSSITGYRLYKDEMTSYLLGTREEQIKDIRIKVYSFVNDENNKPQEVDDDVWYVKTINSQGRHIEVKNQLISSSALAETLADWLAIYYDNNFTYEVDYRGEPRLNATDIISIEDDYIDNLQATIDEATLKFNGAFKGKLKMRKAMG